MDELIQLVDDKNSNKDCHDKKVWRDDVEGLFFVKSAYFTLHNTEQGEIIVFSKHFGAYKHYF